jgi:hypothetical protein
MHSWIERLYQAQLTYFDQRNPSQARWLREAGGFLLFGTIGSEAVLRPDGSVWICAADNWDDPSPNWEWHEARGVDRWGALVLGAERVPEVAQLLPERPGTSPTCARCAGRSYILGTATSGGSSAQSAAALGGWNRRRPNPRMQPTGGIKTTQKNVSRGSTWLLEPTLDVPLQSPDEGTRRVPGTN